MNKQISSNINPCLRVALILLYLCVVCSVSPAGASPTDNPRSVGPSDLHIGGRFLLSANGVNLVMRGVNHPHTWFTEQTGSLAQIKAKGANTVRVVLSSGQAEDWTENNASDVANVIQLCKTNKLICVLEVHDTTGDGEVGDAITLAQAVEYWKRIKSALLGQEAYVIINIGNEPYGNPPDNNPNATLAWIADTKNAILALRNDGFQHMLMVDAPNWGQDWQLVMRNNAASIFNTDPLHNTVFSIHMYEVFETAAGIQDYLSHFVNAGLPVVVGEFGPVHEGGDPDEDAIMAAAESLGIGYLGWSWSGNCCGGEELDMVVDFNPNQETSWGNRIFHGPNGIGSTSREASIYSGDRNPVVSSIQRGKPNPTGGASVSFAVTFSESVTGVDTTAPFSDFTLTTTGITGASITGVSGSGSTRTVTVNTGSGSGTIRLNVVDNGSIKDGTNNSLAGPQTGNGNFTSGDTYTITKPTNVDVSIGGVLEGQFFLAQMNSTRYNFPGVSNGPVKITNTMTLPMLAAERLIYKVNGTATSFSEMMGMPASQVDTTYWLPWYNNVDLDTQLRIANISNSQATITIAIGGVPQPSFNLGAGQSTRVSYPMNNGPVKIVSTQNIVAAERVIYKIQGVNTSFSEMMALPNSQLNSTYYLPWYNNVDLDTQLRIANVSNSDATVTVTIGGVPQPSFNLAAGLSTRVSYPVNNGPVKIVSTQNIVAAERVIYKVNNTNTSFTEMMGVPAGEVSSTYWLPWYNNVDLDTQLRIANVSGSLTTVTVTIGGVAQPSFNLAAGASTRISYPANNGPVKIVSTNGVPIVAAERVIYKVNNINASFSEMMGLPNSQLNITYWLPWYNNVDLDTQLRFGVP